MRCSRLGIAAAVAVLLALNAHAASAATFTFATDPFAGSTAPTTPGRQVVGGETFISFDPAADLFEFNPLVFGVASLQFANDLVENLPASGVNTIVLRTFDNDGDPTTQFGAGNAANLIAGQLTGPGPGFFIYFNSGLDLPRLVYSTDLSDPTADLKILARMVNLSGQSGRDELASFTAANFALATPIPEPTSLALMTAAGGIWALRRRRRG